MVRHRCDAVEHFFMEHVHVPIELADALVDAAQPPVHAAQPLVDAIEAYLQVHLTGLEPGQGLIDSIESLFRHRNLRRQLSPLLLERGNFLAVESDGGVHRVDPALD